MIKLVGLTKRKAEENANLTEMLTTYNKNTKKHIYIYIHNRINGANTKIK
jgi:hypothetical protein